MDREEAGRLWGVPLTWLPLCLMVLSFFFAVGTWTAVAQRSEEVWFEESNAFDDLYNGDAVPDFGSTCTAAKHFTLTQAFVLLNTFPGSGGTAVRRAIEDGTRIYTGSQFDNVHLFRAGFMGELLDSFAQDKCPVSAIQSHYPYFALRDPKTSAVVLLMRNPFAALHADFVRSNLVHNTTHQNGLFAARFEEQAHKWRQFSSFWLGDEQHAVNKQGGVVSITLQRAISNNRPVPVLVLFHEDFARDWAGTAKRLFGFLKDQLQENMAVSVDDAVACSVSQRRPVAPVRAINLYDALPALHTSRACEEWKDVWFEEVWGACARPRL